MNQEYLTKGKYEEFSHELEDLRTNKRKEIAEALEYAKSLGDLSENAEYHEARENQARIEDRILHLENLLKHATIISDHSTGNVNVGSMVTISKEGVGDKKTYTIVGGEEADVSVGKISMKSPLGEAVMGKGKGESFSFKSPSGMITYKVVDIK